MSVGDEGDAANLPTRRPDDDPTRPQAMPWAQYVDSVLSKWHQLLSPIEGARVLAAGVVDVPGAPAGHRARDGQRHVDGVPVRALIRLRQRSSTAPRWERRCRGVVLGCLLICPP